MMSRRKMMVQDIERPVRELDATEAAAVRGGMDVQIGTMETTISDGSEGGMSPVLFRRILSRLFQ
jgi:hypothetical protein